MQKAFKFRIYPTPEQQHQLAIDFGCARWVWNHALSMRSKAYKRRKESLNYVPLNKHINALKKTNRFAWLKDAGAATLTQKLIDQDKAFQAFFKQGAKYPKFKKKLHKQSIRYQLDQRQLKSIWSAGEFLKLPKLSYINVRWSQIPTGIPKMVTLSMEPSGRYFIAFACEVDIKPLPKTGKSIGIDIGIKDVIVTSDGQYSGAPKFTYQYQRKLKLAQRSLSRKTKGSNRWHKQRIVVARIHAKIASSRLDFLHKITTGIVRGYDQISIEDLNVSGMLKNRCLSKAVADVGIFELTRQLEYKALWYGKAVTKIDRWFPSTKTCSTCGTIHEMTLKDRVMKCDCGLEICRDLNAAINIELAGNVRCGESYQPGAAAHAA